MHGWTRSLLSSGHAKQVTHTTTGETPFSLAYGVDVIILVEPSITIFRIENFNEEDYDVLLALAIDLLKEKR